MKLQVDKKILIVGLGLLGGSYARALTKKGYTVTAITKEQSSVDYAIKEEIIQKGSAFVDETLCRDADLVIFALYPHVFLEWIEKHQHLLKPGALLTDVTGVKSVVVDRVQGMLRHDLEFIAAHPMAGREYSGVENSDDSIFHGANYVVTPTEKNTPDAIALCEELGRTLGFSHISRLSPKEHDTVIAFVSQLTHCIALSLMTCQPTEQPLEDYTGDSFRDLTRIARMNDEMWSELFLLNKDALLDQMSLFQDELSKLKVLLREGDREGLRRMMQKSTQRRALFDKKI